MNLIPKSVPMVMVLVSLTVPHPAIAVQNQLESLDDREALEYEALLDQCYNLAGETALAACDRALELTPDNAVLWTNRGVILHEQLGQTPEALDSHDRAIALSPEYALALYNRCVVLTALERYEEAIASCDRALEGNGQWGEANPANAWTTKGVALRRLGRYSEALGAYDRALEFVPDYALAWNNRGVALMNLGRYSEAEAAFVRALELDPENELAERNLNIVRQELGSQGQE